MKSAANLLLYRVVVKVLLEVVENVFEPQKIFRRRFTQRFVSCQQFPGLLFFFQGFGGQCAAFRSARAVAGDLKKLIETKAGKQLAAAFAAMHHPKVSLPKFLQSQGQSRHCSHKSGIHHHAIDKIDHELAIAAVYHFAGKLLEISAVQKTAFALHPDPDGRAAYSDLNRRFHNNYRTLWTLALTVKQTSPIRKSVSRLQSGRVR